MQRTGDSKCAYCMKETKEFWYYLPFLDVCFRLEINEMGHYRAKVTGDSEAEITLLGRPKLYNGLPQEFRIRCLHEGTSEEFTIQPDKRICPHCYKDKKKITYLSSLTGYVPTYTIAVVGRPSTGKTGWANSCIYGSRKAGIGKFIYSKRILSQHVRLNATQMTERNGLIQEFFLTNKRGKVKALILLCDTPGELLTQAKEIRGMDYQWHMERVLNADAIMYILDDRGQSTESSWLSDIINYTAEDHPIAIVMTKTDKLKGQTIVISGVFEKHSREEYKEMIEKNGGKNAGSISSKTSFVLAGNNMGPSKLEKAQKLGIKIMDEDNFLKLLE